MRTGKIIVIIFAAVCFISADAKAVPPADLKPDQAIQAREGDTWSDATFLKKEGRKLYVRYADGTEEWVTPDRVRAVDGASAPAESSPDKSESTDAHRAALRAAAAAKLGHHGSHNAHPDPGSGGGTATGAEGPFTEIELQPTKTPAKRANVPLSLKPSTRPSTAFTDLTPSAGTDLGRLDDLIACTDTPGVIVAVGGRNDDDTPILCINVNRSSDALESRVFTAHDHHIVAAADGGRVLLTQPTTFRSLTLHTWEYRDGKYQLKTNYTFASGKGNKHPDWARLLSPTRLLLRSDFGETYLIDLPSKRQIGFIQCGDITVHPSGQFLISTKDGAGIVLRTSDLAIVAQVPHCEAKFTIDATGTFAATSDSRSLTVMKVASGQQLSQVFGITGRGHIDLLGQSDLLVDDKTYYDLKTGIPVWSYNVPDGSSVMLPNGQMLFVSASLIAVATLPDAEAASALSKASPDKFIISPGAHIAIAGDLNGIGNAGAARTNLEHAITAAGHKPDDSAKEYKLTVTSAAGPTGKFGVREFQMMGPPVTREVDAPSTIVNVVLTKGAETIWKRELKFSAQIMIMRQKDETLEQAVANAGKPDPNRLGSLDLPGYIVKGASPDNKMVTLGESTLTRSGFASTATPP